MGKESAYNVGDLGSIPGWGRSPWRRQWQLTLVHLPGENPMDRGASEAIDHGVAKSQTRLSNFPRFPINKILVQLREFSLKQVGKKKKKRPGIPWQLSVSGLVL